MVDFGFKTNDVFSSETLSPFLLVRNTNARKLVRIGDEILALKFQNTVRSVNAFKYF